jgi:hypothetical protein
VGLFLISSIKIQFSGKVCNRYMDVTCKRKQELYSRPVFHKQRERPKCADTVLRIVSTRPQLQHTGYSSSKAKSGLSAYIQFFNVIDLDIQQESVRTILKTT